MNRYIFVFLYIILTAISVTYIHTLGKHIPDDLIMLFGSFYALILFNLVNIKNIGVTYKKVFSVKKLFINLLFTFLVTWVLTIIIPIYFTPALLVFFFMAWPACIGSYFQYKATHTKINLTRFILIGLSILIFYICLGFIYSTLQYMYLIIALTTVGVAGYCYNRVSFKMNKHNFSAVEILSLRFWLLFLIPLVSSIMNKHIYLINGSILLDTLALSFISMIIPVYCSQISVQRIGPNVHSMLIGITPFAAFLIEIIFLPKTNNNVLDGLFSAILASIIIFSYLLQKLISKANSA